MGAASAANPAQATKRIRADPRKPATALQGQHKQVNLVNTCKWCPDLLLYFGQLAIANLKKICGSGFSRESSPGIQANQSKSAKARDRNNKNTNQLSEHRHRLAGKAVNGRRKTNQSAADAFPENLPAALPNPPQQLAPAASSCARLVPLQRSSSSADIEPP